MSGRPQGCPGIAMQNVDASNPSGRHLPKFAVALGGTVAVFAALAASSGAFGPDVAGLSDEPSALTDRRAQSARVPLSDEARVALARALSEVDPALAPVATSDAFTLRAPTGLSARIDAGGAETSVGSHRVRFVLRGVAREGEGAAHRNSSRTLTRNGHELRIDHGAGVVEWWRALRTGIEHGVDVSERAPGVGSLVVDIDVTGDLAPRASSNEGILLVDVRGDVVASYRDLVVVDARGDRVDARFGVTGDTIRVFVDDADAEYPIVIDPTIYMEEKKLLVVSPDKGTNDEFGGATSFDATATRVVVGARGQDEDTAPATTDNGAAYVFVRSGTTWTLERKLLAPDRSGGAEFGWDVAMSSDGTRVVVGARGQSEPNGPATTKNGAAYVFVRSGTTWSDDIKLLAPDRATDDEFGISVAIDGSGSRIVVGAWQEDDATGTSTTDNGAAYVFARTGSAWTIEQKLLAIDRASSDSFGYSVAISGDGSRVALGAHDEDDPTGTNTTGNGAVYVFVRSGTAWSHEQKLLAADKASNDRFGVHVDFDRDARRLLACADTEDDPTGTNTTDSGAAYVFVRSGSVWSQEAKLLASDKASSDNFGSGGAFDAAGDRVVVGAYCKDSYRGAAYVFDRDDTTWNQTQRLDASDRAAVDYFGHGMSVSADGSRVVIGALFDDDPTGTSTTNNGAAYVFALGTGASTCSQNSQCPSGYCVGGQFCCNQPCGGDATDDCQACSASSTGLADGVCAPLVAAVASSLVCRPPTDACDAAEKCTDSSRNCPADSIAPPDIVCRAQAGVCDVAEYCDGASASCPADLVASDSTQCDDGIACTATSACSAGVCQPTLVLDCADSDPCTSDSCSEPSGCVHLPAAICSGDGGTADASTDVGAATNTSSIVNRGTCAVHRVGPPWPADVFAMMGFVLTWSAVRRRRSTLGRSGSTHRHGQSA